MKIAISSFSESIPKSLDSHYHGWAMIMRQHLMLLEDRDWKVDILTGPDAYQHWHEYDIVYFHHGLYYYGDSDFALNLFGGMTPEKEKEFQLRLQALIDLKSHQIDSLEYSWPLKMFEAIANRSKEEHTKRLCAKASEHVAEATEIGSYGGDYPGTCFHTLYVFRHLQSVIPPAGTLRTVVFGDSHAGASWRPNSMVLRNDRLTLNGALNRGLLTMIEERTKHQLSLKNSNDFEFVFHLGNIDVRHHICRLGQTRDGIDKVIDDLLGRFREQCIELKAGDITWVAPYPIENPSRRISKSVFYKDQAFWGSWEDRTYATNQMWRKMRDICVAMDWKFEFWGPKYFNDKGELSFEAMEKPKSIHLSPRYYRNWELLNPKPSTSLGCFFS